MLLRSLYAEDRCDDESDLKICIVRTEGNVVILKASMMLEIVHLGRKLNQNSYLTEERNGDSMNVLTKAGQRLQDKSFWGAFHTMIRLQRLILWWSLRIQENSSCHRSAIAPAIKPTNPIMLPASAESFSTKLPEFDDELEVGAELPLVLLEPVADGKPDESDTPFCAAQVFGSTP